MQLPAVNINGTSRSELLEGYLNARRAVAQAIEATGEAWPHGRDYQTLPPEAHQRAMEEHAERMRNLRKVHADLETLAEAIV